MNILAQVRVQFESSSYKLSNCIFNVQGDGNIDQDVDEANVLIDDQLEVMPEDNESGENRSNVRGKIFKSSEKVLKRKRETSLKVVTDYLKKKMSETANTPIQGDEYSIFGQLVIEKLRRMEHYDRQFAINVINNVMFQTVMKKIVLLYPNLHLFLYVCRHLCLYKTLCVILPLQQVFNKILFPYHLSLILPQILLFLTYLLIPSSRISLLLQLYFLLFNPATPSQPHR